MYENVGGKIKGVAKTFTVIGIIISVLLFIVLMIPAGEAAEEGSEAALILPFVVLIIGCIISWLSSLVLYGFGQLVENSDIIAGKRNYSRLSEVNEDSYKNDPYYKASEPDERTFEQVLEDSNLSNEQKKRIKELREWLDDDLIDLTDCCKRIRKITSDQPEEIIVKIIAKL